MRKSALLIPGILCCLLSGASVAGNTTRDAAIGGGAGGAIGGALGSEIGGRDGAILGSAVGAALGTAIATDGDNDRRDHHHDQAPVRVDVGVADHHQSHFCPPGQRKKHNC